MTKFNFGGEIKAPLSVWGVGWARAWGAEGGQGVGDAGRCDGMGLRARKGEIQVNFKVIERLIVLAFKWTA